MEAKKNELAETQDALAELSEALVALGASVSAKKNELRAQKKQDSLLLKDKENRLEILKTSSVNVLHGIDRIITQLDKVLENNGTGHNNN